MFDEIMERSNMQCLVRYLLYGNETSPRVEPGSYEKRLKRAEDQFYKELKKKYPHLTPDDDHLYVCMADILTEHDEVYMEMGVAVGIMLGKHMALDWRMWNGIY